MASKSDLTEDKKLTCSICIDTYKQPRYLPTCGHTFCENCLFTYIHNAQQDAGRSTFACPVCRKPHDLPEDTEVTLEWIQTLPLNTFINKMIETSESTEGTSSRMCEPCKAGGEQIVGVTLCCDCRELLCKDCTKCHRNFKMSKHHKLIHVCDLPKQDSRVDLFSGVSMCLNHPKWGLDLYCRSHDSVICAGCIAADNTTCDIECDIMQFTSHDIDMDILGEEMEKVRMHMKALFEHLEFLQTAREENKKNIKQKLKEIRENTEQTRDRFAELMEHVVRHVRDVTKQVEYDTEHTLDGDILRITELKQATEQKYVRLETAGKHGSERHTFVSVQQMKTLSNKFEEDISEEDTLMKTIEVELKLTDDIGRLLEDTEAENVEKLVELKIERNESNHAHLGDVSCDWNQRRLVVNPLRDSNLVKAEEHTVRPNAECQPSYTGIEVLHDGRLILADYCNLSVDCGYLCLYNPANQTVDKLKLDCPSDVTQIDDTHLAVCIPNQKNISIVALKNELRVEKSFQTQTKPLSIVALQNGQLAVSSEELPSFSINDISGTNLVQILYLEQDKDGRKFKSFAYFAVDERRQHIIQSCYVDSVVYCFDFTGEPMFRYSHAKLTDPMEVALDKCGNIYVCDYNSPGSIHKISPAGEPISIFTEGVPNNPLAICRNSSGTTFWVTQETDEGCDEVISFELL